MAYRELEVQPPSLLNFDVSESERSVAGIHRFHPGKGFPSHIG